MKTKLFYCVGPLLLLGIGLVAAGCRVDDGSAASSNGDPTLPSSTARSSGSAGPSGSSAASSSATNGPDAGCRPTCDGACGLADGCGGTCSCAAGQGCGPSGACVACAKACGPNGTCVVGWEGGEHCRCDAGYYDTGSGCAPSAGTACSGVTCSGHGTCSVTLPLSSAQCRCEGDYVEYGLACARRDAIRCIDADGTLKDKGSIRCNATGSAFEVCRDGDGDGRVEWVASGTPSCGAGLTCQQCLDAKCDNHDGTGGQPCPTGTVCMGMVHEMPVYRCVASCDCSNCGTCDPGQFTGYQRACGSTDDSFDHATKACASPCPHASDGCLPYGEFAFCFGNEGCASAAPK